MRNTVCIFYSALLLGATGGSLSANLPVMNTLPRWDHGFGFQADYEYKEKTRPTKKTRQIQNEDLPREEGHELSLQGVLSFAKEYRLFLRVPWQTQTRTEQGSIQKNSHIGEVFLGAAFKKYYNLKGIAADIGFAPLVHWSDSTFSETDWAGSLSLMANVETYYFLGISFCRSKFGLGKTSRELFFQQLCFLSGGYHFFHTDRYNIGGWLSLGIEGRYDAPGENASTLIFTDDGFSIDVIPSLMIYRDNYLLQVRLFLPVFRPENIRNGVAHELRMQISVGGAFFYK